MEAKQYQEIIKELKLIRKLLTAYMYSAGIDSTDLDKITSMGSANIRGLVSRKKVKGEKNAEKK